jgi:hypothetical protein
LVFIFTKKYLPKNIFWYFLVIFFGNPLKVEIFLNIVKQKLFFWVQKSIGYKIKTKKNTLKTQSANGDVNGWTRT